MFPLIVLADCLSVCLPDVCKIIFHLTVFAVTHKTTTYDDSLKRKDKQPGYFHSHVTHARFPNSPSYSTKLCGRIILKRLYKLPLRHFDGVRLTIIPPKPSIFAAYYMVISAVVTSLNISAHIRRITNAYISPLCRML